MTETFFVKRRKIADSITEAQSHAVEAEKNSVVLFIYRTDEKLIQFYLTTTFLKHATESRVRNYLNYVIQHFLHKKGEPLCNTET